MQILVTASILIYTITLLKKEEKHNQEIYLIAKDKAYKLRLISTNAKIVRSIILLVVCHIHTDGTTYTDCLFKLKDNK